MSKTAFLTAFEIITYRKKREKHSQPKNFWIMQLLTSYMPFCLTKDMNTVTRSLLNYVNALIMHLSSSEHQRW